MAHRAPPKPRKGPVLQNSAHRRKLQSAKRVLFVGLNSKSYGLAETMAKQTGDDFMIYIYTDEVDTKSQEVAVRVPVGRNKRRKSSAASAGRQGSHKKAAVTKSPQVMGTHYLQCFKQSVKGNAAKRVHYVYSSRSLREIKGLDYVFYATTAEYMNSNQGLNIKRTIATYSKQAVWIHLSFHPEVDALSTRYAEDNERARLVAVPLYTSFQPPAQHASLNTLDTRYWYKGYPILLQNPFIGEEWDTKAVEFVKIMARNKLYVKRVPPLEDFVKKSERKQEEYLISLLLDVRKRVCLLPLMLHLEFKLYLSKFSKISKAAQGNMADSEREDERITTLVRESFTELKRQDQGVFFALIDMSNHDFVQRLLTSLKRRYLSSRFDNKSSADVADAVSRINELRRELNGIVKSKPKNFAHCSQLVRETDVYAKFKDIRIW